MPRQHARVPGDVAGVVAHEVAHLQRVPQRALCAAGQRIQAAAAPAPRACGPRSSASGSGARAAERAQGVAVQVFQQLALPGVPDLRAGAADVGHGEQVERRQRALVADPPGEGGDHLGVAQVFLLRRRGSWSGARAPGTRSASASSRSMPWSRQKRRTSSAPRSEWSPPRPLAMSWNSGGDVEDPGLVPAAPPAASRTGTRAHARP